MQKLFETGIEKRENKKCWWGGRRFNFNEAKEETKVEGTPEASPKREKLSKKKENSKSKDIRQKNRRNSPKPNDTPEVVKAKGAILIKMNEIFGKENLK